MGSSCRNKCERGNAICEWGLRAGPASGLLDALGLGYDLPVGQAVLETFVKAIELLAEQRSCQAGLIGLGREISRKFYFNLAPPPDSLEGITMGPKFVSLGDFIEDFDWKYSDLDIIDRLEIKQLAVENFWRYIAKSEVPIQEPGHLSPVTVGKCIEYGLSLLGCFIEVYVGSKQSLGKDADFGTMTRAALESARGTFAGSSEEHNWYEHFELLMKHPVINAGVQIAAWHYYRLPEDLLST